MLEKLKSKKQKKPEISEFSSTPENQEEIQNKIREKLRKRFSSMKVDIKDKFNEYKESLKNGDFEDIEGEEEGSGEKRKTRRQIELESMLDRANVLNKKIESKEILKDIEDSLSTPYTHEDGHIENITINIEQKIEEYIEFYKKHNLDVSPDFEDTMKDIWSNNIDSIEKEIGEQGYNEILLIPPTPNLPDLADKMKETTYYENNNFKNSGSFEQAKSKNVDKPRLILVHKVQNLAEHPELAKTLNILGSNVPLDKTLTLEDYLIFSKKYFEETGKHLDEGGWTWLATKSGSRLVSSDWRPVDDLRNVSAHDLTYQASSLGFRPSCSYYK